MPGKTHSVNMLEGPIWNRMIVFALPLALTGMMQQLFNIADIAVLGRMVSAEAMAGVGNNVPVIGLILSLCMGLALGANVITARFLGMKDPEKTSAAVHTAFATALLFGIGATVLGEAAAGPMLDALSVPASVRADSEAYLRAFLLGMPFVALYNFLAAVLRSCGDTKTPLYALAVAGVFNLIGNLFFVLVCGWGSGGVALATALANGFAAGALYVRLRRSAGPLQLLPARLFNIDSYCLKAIFRVGMPAGIQSAVFSVSNLLIQSAINSLGSEAMAASVAAFTVEINIYCFINAFGLAATTYVSQNWGAGNLERCRRATWISMGLNFVATVIMVAVVMVFGRVVLGFICDSDKVLELAMIRLYWVAIPEVINVVMETLSDAMRGYGYSMPPAVVTLVAICGVRVIWLWTVFAAEPTYAVLMAVYPVSWVVTTIGLLVLYRRHSRSMDRAWQVRAARKAAGTAEAADL